MWRFVIAILVTGFLFSGCEKYKLKQPCSLNFKWDFYNGGQNAYEPFVVSGAFYPSKLDVHGIRYEGPEVDIEQSLPPYMVTFSSQGALPMSMDIPVGDYDNFEAILHVDDAVQPCLVLRGSCNVNGNHIPFVVEWTSELQLRFATGSDFTLKKKKDYTMVVGIDVSRLMSDITEDKWNAASVTSVDGQPTVVIRDGTSGGNHVLFDLINANLESALTLIKE